MWWGLSDVGEKSGRGVEGTDAVGEEWDEGMKGLLAILEGDTDGEGGEVVEGWKWHGEEFVLAA